MRDIGAVKTNKERPLNSDEIKKNINELKAKLKKNTTTPINQHLYFGINNVNISELSWMDPLASQVISDESEIVKKLPGQFKHTFMKPVRQMVPLSLPSAVKENVMNSLLLSLRIVKLIFQENLYMMRHGKKQKTSLQ